MQHLDYYPSGEIWREEKDANRLRGEVAHATTFTGKELDASGYYYYGARYYDPQIGMWLSPDPMLGRYMQGSPAGGVFQPRNLGLYTYTWNNPVVLKDPDGKVVDTIFDIGFTLFDVGKLIYDEARGNTEDRAMNIAALGADAAAIFVPFATGAGVAVRLGAKGVEAGRAVEAGVHIADAAKTAEHVAEAGKAAGAAGDVGTAAKQGKRNFSKAERAEGLEKAKDAQGAARCEHCGTKLEPKAGKPNSYEADHRTPHARGGPTTQENLAPSCRTCNRSKGSKTVEEWKK